MIISASRRTDVPAFHTGWFIRRLEEQYVMVRNPYGRKQIRRFRMHPDVVDRIVFWTKNAAPMIPRLYEIDRRGYHYYFQYTVTAFDNKVERGLPDKERQVDTFIELSEKIGKKKVDWRFDPIMVNTRYSVSWHIERFEWLCEKLHKHTEKCIISFADPYTHIRPVISAMEYEEIMEVSRGLAGIAKKYGLSLFTCSEEAALDELGIQHGSCIDKRKIEEIIGCRLDVKKDRNQRFLCGCMDSIDIGSYNTCGYDCSYCYACISELEKRKLHKFSPMMSGYPGIQEEVETVEIASNKILQQSLFD